MGQFWMTSLRKHHLRNTDGRHWEYLRKFLWDEDLKSLVLWKVHTQICRSLYLILNSVRSCRRVLCFRRITPGKEFYLTPCNKRLCNWSCIMKEQLTVQYMVMDRSSRKRKIKDSHVWEWAPGWIMVQLMVTKAGRKKLGSDLVELKQGVWRHYV